MTCEAAVPQDEPTASNAALDLGTLYEVHFDFVWRTLRRYGVPEASLDDAIQDTFLVVRARLAQFAGRSSVRTWIFGVARRVARDHRRSASGGNGGADELEALPDLASKSPLATLEAVDGTRLLERLLATLAPKKREAFILVELEEMTVPEVSQALDTNPNTVAARVRAARQELKHALVRLEAHSHWRQRCGT